MNGNDHSAAARGRPDLLAALLSSIRRARDQLLRRHFSRRRVTLRAAAHQITVTVAMAGAGQAYAQAIPSDGWARMSPNAGFGFGFYMEVGRSRGHEGASAGKYDLLYSDQAQSMDSQVSRRESRSHSSTAPTEDPEIDPVLRNLASAGVMTVALGLNEAIPMMVFTGAISNRCVARYLDCGGYRPRHEPVSQS
ncbi:hypothetical protein [Paraburkholderia unamae]|uniref:Uncharacterized protein n=1 Tax=Paraburkholderia unamae TaxID=219649 RepID=A0ACC6RRZ2_9BURK